MNADAILLFCIWVVFVSLTLTLLIKVNWKDWGLVGLLILSGAVTTLLTMININEWHSPQDPSTNVPGYSGMLWGWRIGAGIGGTLVLLGLVLEFARNPPFFWQSIRRILLGTFIVVAIAAFFWF